MPHPCVEFLAVLAEIVSVALRKIDAIFADSRSQSREDCWIMQRLSIQRCRSCSARAICMASLNVLGSVSISIEVKYSSTFAEVVLLLISTPPQQWVRTAYCVLCRPRLLVETRRRTGSALSVSTSRMRAASGALELVVFRHLGCSLMHSESQCERVGILASKSTGIAELQTARSSPLAAFVNIGQWQHILTYHH